MFLKRNSVRNFKLKETKRSQSLFLVSYLHINNIYAKKPELLCCIPEANTVL